MQRAAAISAMAHVRAMLLVSRKFEYQLEAEFITSLQVQVHDILLMAQSWGSGEKCLVFCITPKMLGQLLSGDLVLN